MDVLQGVSNQNIYFKINQQTTQQKQTKIEKNILSQDCFVKQNEWEKQLQTNCYSQAMIEQNQNSQENHIKNVEMYIEQLQNRLDFEISDEMKKMWKENKTAFEHYQKLIGDLLENADVHGQQYKDGMIWNLKLDKNGTLYFWNEQVKSEKEDAVANMLEQLKEQNNKPIKPLKLVTYRKEKGGRHITEIMGQNGQVVRLEFVRRIRYSPSKDVGRLASTTNVANTQSFIIGLNANMNRIGKDKFADKEEIKAAVAKMRQVVGKAKVKIRKLKAEELEKKRMQKSEQNEELQKAREIAETIRKMKTKRKIGEYTPIKGYHIPSYLLPKKKEKIEYEEGFGLSEFSGMSYQVMTTGTGGIQDVVQNTTPVSTTDVSQAVQIAQSGGMAAISVDLGSFVEGAV